jgi:hypothetical protein
MGSGWIGSAQDPAITDPTLASGQVSLIALLKGLLTQAQGGGPAGKAQPAVLYGPNGQPLNLDAHGSAATRVVDPAGVNVLAVNADGTINSKLAGSLAPLPSLGEVDIISSLAAQAGAISVPASGSYMSPTTPALLGQRFATAFAVLSTAATNSLAVWSPSGYGFATITPTYVTSITTNAAYLAQTIIPNGSDAVINIANNGSAALTIKALGWKCN